MGEHDAAGPLPRGLSRRGFLIAAAGTGVAFAFARPGEASQDPAAPIAERRFEPALWYHIDVDGIVTVNVKRAEIGQHVGTALARIVAEELEADWSQVRVVHVDTDPRWGEMATGGSLSVFESFEPLSRAGAAGRLALTLEAERLLGIPAHRCVVHAGRVQAGSRSIGFGEIVRRGQLKRRFSADELARLPLKKPRDRRLVGHDTAALDIPEKVDGRTRYGIDAEAPGMVFARPLVPPTRNGSRVLHVDERDARAVRGYLQHLVIDDPTGNVPGWVLAIGTDFDAARRAGDALRVQWTSDETAGVAEKDVLERGAHAVADDKAGALFVEDAGVEAGFAAAAMRLERQYTTASALHFQMEPLNALAFEKDGKWEIHAGSQWPTHIQPVLARALGVAPERVMIRAQSIGGGFGRRLNGDYLLPAALASRALGRPVKLVFTRADDVRFDSFRSPSVQRLRIAFGPGREVLAMEHVAAAGWPNKSMDPDSLVKGVNGELYDPDAIGGSDHWYSVGAQRVRAVCNELANRTFRPGWLRSVGSGWTNWALESFMDEAARSIDEDPLAFRLRLLDAKGRNAGAEPASVGGARRQAQVLRRVAERAGWGQALPPDTGLGLATTFGQSRDMPTWVACAARVKVDRGTGHVTLERLTLAIDAGTLVHPDGALAQAEGAALWGASLALHEGTLIERGQVKDTNLDTYTPLRMGDVPAIDIEFIPNDYAPVGMGEPATTVVAPAIGNAVFQAVGVRMRHLPIRAEAVLEALSGKGSG
jgi:CO/xanthine dehydrogenase Mo-binding subunit